MAARILQFSVSLTDVELKAFRKITAALDGVYVLCDLANQPVQACNVAGVLAPIVDSMYGLVAELDERARQGGAL